MAVAVGQSATRELRILMERAQGTCWSCPEITSKVLSSMQLSLLRERMLACRRECSRNNCQMPTPTPPASRAVRLSSLASPTTTSSRLPPSLHHHSPPTPPSPTSPSPTTRRTVSPPRHTHPIPREINTGRSAAYRFTTTATRALHTECMTLSSMRSQPSRRKQESAGGPARKSQRRRAQRASQMRAKVKMEPPSRRKSMSSAASRQAETAVWQCGCVKSAQRLGRKSKLAQLQPSRKQQVSGPMGKAAQTSSPTSWHTLIVSISSVYSPGSRSDSRNSTITIQGIMMALQLLRTAQRQYSLKVSGRSPTETALVSLVQPTPCPLTRPVPIDTEYRLPISRSPGKAVQKMMQLPWICTLRMVRQVQPRSERSAGSWLPCACRETTRAPAQLLRATHCQLEESSPSCASTVNFSSLPWGSTLIRSRLRLKRTLVSEQCRQERLPRLTRWKLGHADTHLPWQLQLYSVQRSQTRETLFQEQPKGHHPRHSWPSRYLVCVPTANRHSVQQSGSPSQDAQPTLQLWQVLVRLWRYWPAGHSLRQQVVPLARQQPLLQTVHSRLVSPKHRMHSAAQGQHTRTRMFLSSKWQSRGQQQVWFVQFRTYRLGHGLTHVLLQRKDSLRPNVQQRVQQVRLSHSRQVALQVRQKVSLTAVVRKSVVVFLQVAWGQSLQHR